MNEYINQSNVYLKSVYVSGLHTKILIKLEKLLESREKIMNMVRKLLKSHGGLIQFDLKEFICEQPYTTSEDLNSFSETLSKKNNRMNAVC